jgi:hypothetical protein
MAQLHIVDFPEELLVRIRRAARGLMFIKSFVIQALEEKVEREEKKAATK